MSNTLTQTRPSYRRFTNPLRLLVQWFAVAEQRHRLSQLDRAALKDMGITREAALAEAGRPFWDAPAHWCK
jgi:uncharacterized protein YjiS (DUF1127 family)